MKTKAQKKAQKEWLKTDKGKKSKRKTQREYRKKKRDNEHAIEYYI